MNTLGLVNPQAEHQDADPGGLHYFNVAGSGLFLGRKHYRQAAASEVLGHVHVLLDGVDLGLS
jgi:hypothetical protein